MAAFIITYIAKAGLVSIRTIRKYTTFSPTTPPDGIKIGNAKQYLETTDYSIKKIAQITGFATPSHFCERFARIVGETPQQYRRNVQKPDFSDMHYTPVV